MYRWVPYGDYLTKCACRLELSDDVMRKVVPGYKPLSVTANFNPADRNTPNSVKQIFLAITEASARDSGYTSDNVGNIYYNGDRYTYIVHDKDDPVKRYYSVYVSKLEVVMNPVIWACVAVLVMVLNAAATNNIGPLSLIAPFMKEFNVAFIALCSFNALVTMACITPAYTSHWSSTRCPSQRRRNAVVVGLLVLAWGSWVVRAVVTLIHPYNMLMI